ncbi:MAG: hypothetical protein KDK44_03085, partial [Chlamydiia bacterium]|nr:hypothetical protein [Chlamydiia bacterium]
MADASTHSDQKLEEFRNCLAFEQLKAIELIQEVKRDALDEELESIVKWTFQRSKTHHGATASILNILWKNTLKASIALEQGLPDQFFLAIDGIISGPQNRQEIARQLRIWLSYAFGQVESYLRWQKNDPTACVKLIGAAREHFSVAFSIAQGVVDSLDEKHPSFSIFQELVEDCQMMQRVLEAETYTQRLPYLLIPSHSHRSFDSRDITAFSNCMNEVFSDIALLIRLWDDYLSQAEKVRSGAIKAQFDAYIETLRELERQIKPAVNALDSLQINEITEKSHKAFKEIIAQTQKFKEPNQFHDVLAFNWMLRNSHVWLHIDVSNLKKGMISKQELNLYIAAVQKKMGGYPVKSSYFSPIDCLLADLELKRYQLTVILPGGYCYHALQNLTNETLIFARDLERLHLQSRQGLSMEKCLDVFFDDLALRKNTIETLLSRLEKLKTKLAEINITLPEATINSFEDVSKLEGSQVFFENISPVLPDLLAFAIEYDIASAYGDDMNALVGAIVRAVLSKKLIDEYFSEYSQLTEALIYDLFSSDPITTILRLQKESLALDRVFSLFQPLGNVHIDLCESDITALDKMRYNYYQSLEFLTGLGGSWNDDVHLGEKNFSDPRSKQK